MLTIILIILIVLLLGGWGYGRWYQPWPYADPAGLLGLLLVVVLIVLLLRAL
jgi:hypothetical protein